MANPINQNDNSQTLNELLTIDFEQKISDLESESNSYWWYAVSTGAAYASLSLPIIIVVCASAPVYALVATAVCGFILTEFVYPFTVNDLYGEHAELAQKAENYKQTLEIFNGIGAVDASTNPNFEEARALLEHVGCRFNGQMRIGHHPLRLLQDACHKGFAQLTFQTQVAKKAQEIRNEHNRKKTEHKAFLDDSSNTDVDARAEAKTNFDYEQRTIYELDEIIIKTKIRAAFTLHVIKNPIGNTKLEDIGTPSTASFEENGLERENDGIEPFFFKRVDNEEFTRNALRSMDIQEIYDAVFASLASA